MKNLRDLLSRGSNSTNGTVTQDRSAATTAYSPNSPATFDGGKHEKSGDNNSLVDSEDEELTTVVDPSLNPGALSFEEGRRSVIQRTRRYT